MPALLKPRERPQAPVSIDNLERFAYLMDRAFRIPGTNIRVGLDAIVGLLPFGGDALMGLVQLGLVGVALTRYKVPKAVAARMFANILLDVGVGAVPILGDLFDVAFKANTRNVALLRQARDHEAKGEPMPAGPSRRFFVWLAAGFLAAIGLMIAGLLALFVWLLRAFPLV